MLCEASWLWEFIQQPTPAPSPPSIAWDEYDKLLKTFKTNDWTKMGDWLRVYNATVVVPFIETLTKMTEQYYLNKIDVSKDGGSIPGIWMRHVLNKVLPKKKKEDWVIFTRNRLPLCRDKREKPQHCNCNGALKCCEKCHLYLQVLQKCECEKTVVYRLLRVDQPKFSEGIMKQGTGQLMKCHVVKTCWLWMISFLIKSEWQNFSWVQEELRNTRCEVDKTP